MQKDAGLRLVGWAGIGAGLMFLLDPNTGARRRGLLRDQFVHVSRKSGDGVRKLGRDLRNRASGIASAVRSVGRQEPVHDAALTDQIRSQMGRAVSHPRAVHVTAQNGKVTLTGDILKSELNRLLRTVAKVPGVHEIDNRMNTHQEAGDVRSLQGGSRKTGSRFPLFQSNWSPTTQFVSTCVGAGIAASGLLQRGTAGSLIGVGGIALAAFSIFRNQVHVSEVKNLMTRESEKWRAAS